MADDFFKKEETTEEKPEGQVEEQEELSDTIKVGEEEYSQDELQKMVGLGKVASELETKWNTDINRLFPEYTKLSQEKKDWVKEKEELSKKPEPVEEEGGEDEIQQAVAKLKELGFVSKDDIDREVSGKVLSVLSAKELLAETESLVKKQASQGNPKLSSEELLGYMQDTGIKDPGFAYRMKFEKELDEIKEKKLSGIKPKGFVTEEAGGGEKVPQPKPLTRHNITEALSEVLNRE